MRKILVIGHGNFALGIQSAVGVLTGDPDSITAISTYLDDRNFTPEIQAFIDSVGEEDEGLILTDTAQLASLVGSYAAEGRGAQAAYGALAQVRARFS